MKLKIVTKDIIKFIAHFLCVNDNLKSQCAPHKMTPFSHIPKIYASWKILSDKEKEFRKDLQSH